MNTFNGVFWLFYLFSRFLFVLWVYRHRRRRCWCCCCFFFIVQRAPYFEHRFSSELCLYEAHNPYTLRRCRKLYEKQHQIRTHFIYLYIVFICIRIYFQIAKKDHLMCECDRHAIVATNFTAHAHSMYTRTKYTNV